MSNKHIVKVIEYKVKDGDTLESIAKSAGISLKELVKFNFGTTDLGLLNSHLRSKIGCLKKDKDDKNYILSNDDDPGIIYLPQDLKLDPFSIDQTHNIKLKLPTKKKFKPGECFVNFRPQPSWNGEYGFDWMREGDFPIQVEGKTINDDLKFEDIIGYHKIVEKGVLIVQPDGNSYQGDFIKDENKLKSLQNKYKIKNIPFTKDNEGKPLQKYSSYLSIFVNDGEFKCPQEVTIQANIEVISPPEALRFQYDHKLLKVEPSELPKATKKESIKITCLQPLKQDETIKVISTFRDENAVSHDVEVGHLIVVKNNKSARKRVKTLLVSIKSPASDPSLPPKTGKFEDNIPFIQRILRQALIDPILNSIKLDLNATPELAEEFKKHFVDGIFVLTSSRINNKYIHQYLFEKLMEGEKNKKKYNDYLVAFYLGIPHKNTYGYSYGNQVIMFSNALESTGVHEWLHSLGLPHTFTGTGEYTYKGIKTENIMDYTHHQFRSNDPSTFHFKKSRVSLFYWQWQWANKHSLTISE